MNSELHEKSPRIFSDRVYTDEPIIKSASSMENYEPSQYNTLWKIRFGAYSNGWSTERIFYEQALVAVDFTDDFKYNKQFLCYMPTYSSLTLPQLRGYFTQRVKFRRGEVENCLEAYAYIYIYELLNQIGVENPTEGYFKLKDFVEKYSVYNEVIAKLYPDWLADYAAFYSIDMEKTDLGIETDFDRAFATVQNYRNSSDEELFAALNYCSYYKPEDSDFYEKYPEECIHGISHMFRKCCDKYSSSKNKSLVSKIFCDEPPEKHIIFNYAVFYNRKNTKDHTCNLSSTLKYEFVDGECYRTYYVGRLGAGIYLKQYLEYFENVLREAFGVEKSSDCACPLKMFIATAKKAAQESVEYFREKKRLEELKFVDVSKLDSIITIADSTREKLITEEETENETDISPIITVDEPDKSNDTDACPLTYDEKDFIKCLIDGESITSYAKSHSLKLSLVCDSINDKLYDMFCDTVIDTGSEPPELIEDYIEDLKEIINK